MTTTIVSAAAINGDRRERRCEGKRPAMAATRSRAHSAETEEKSGKTISTREKERERENRNPSSFLSSLSLSSLSLPFVAAARSVRHCELRYVFVARAAPLALVLRRTLPSSPMPRPLTWLCGAMRCALVVLLTSSIFMAAEETDGQQRREGGRERGGGRAAEGTAGKLRAKVVLFLVATITKGRERCVLLH